MHISRPDGKGLIAIPFKNEDGEIKTYFADVNQLSIPSVDAYVNSPMYRLRTLYRSGIHSNITGQWTPEVFEGTVVFDYSREKVIINGVDYGIEDGLKEIKGSLTKNNQDI